MIIKNIVTSIEEFKAELYTIIAMFQSGHENEATLRVAAATQTISNILSSINSNNIGERMNIDYDKFNTILINTSNCIETGNYILIDDLFEYELIPMLDTWLDNLDTSI